MTKAVLVTLQNTAVCRRGMFMKISRTDYALSLCNVVLQEQIISVGYFQELDRVQYFMQDVC
jgi:hypothetical protein